MTRRDTNPADIVAAADIDRDVHVAAADPWSRTLQLLDTLCAQHRAEGAFVPSHRGRKGPAAPSRAANRRGCRDKDCAAGAPPAVTLLERVSDTRVILRWCSCACHYGYQIWICGTARSAGVCAVTGKLIQRGDAVYRPLNRGRTPPANGDAMLHPSAFD